MERESASESATVYACAQMHSMRHGESPCSAAPGQLLSQADDTRRPRRRTPAARRLAGGGYPRWNASCSTPRLTRHALPYSSMIRSSTDRSRRVRKLVVVFALTAACTRPSDAPLSTSEKKAIADTLRALVVSAYDLSKPGDAVARMMSLYPASGNVVSASGGRMSVSRDSLEAGIRAFWQYVGQNMRDPRWTWDAMQVDVLARDA